MHKQILKVIDHAIETIKQGEIHFTCVALNRSAAHFFLRKEQYDTLLDIYATQVVGKDDLFTNNGIVFVPKDDRFKELSISDKINYRVKLLTNLRNLYETTEVV